MKPLFSYMGGKRRLVPFYQPFLAHLPEHKLYVEPFFGGGAVFASIRKTWQGPAIIGDTSRDLVNLYQALQKDPSFIERALQEFTRLEAIPKTKKHRKEHYYRVRQEYRSSLDPAKFFLLQFYSMNGCCRTDKQGICRNSPGVEVWKKAPTSHLQRLSLPSWQAALQNTSISLGSYEHHSFNPDGAFIFLDPPYRATAGYKTEFDDAAQLQLVTWAKEQASQGATVLLANIDSGDGFFQEAVGQEGSIFTHEVLHLGNKKVTELLAVFTPEGPWKHQALFKGTLFA